MVDDHNPPYSPSDVPDESNDNQADWSQFVRAAGPADTVLNPAEILNFSIQFTGERGFLEPCQNYWDARRRTMEQDAQDVQENLEQARIDAEQAAAQQRDPPDLEEYLTQQINNLYSTGSTGVEHVRRPLPILSAYKRRVKNLLRKDGITDIYKAMSECPICEADVDPMDISKSHELRFEFMNLYWDRYTNTNDEGTYTELARHWNENLTAISKMGGNKFVLPLITWGQVYVHIEHCNKSNTMPLLKRQLRLITAALEVYEDQGFLEERAGNTSTGRYYISDTFTKNVLPLCAEQRRILNEIQSAHLNWKAMRGSPYLCLPEFGKRAKVTQTQLDKLMKKAKEKESATGFGALGRAATGQTQTRQVRATRAPGALGSNLPA